MIDKELGDAIQRLEQLKKVFLIELEQDVLYIIDKKITDDHYIESTLDMLLNFYDDERFLDLFWKLINYTESFNRDIGTIYRRLEETLNEGL